jgi:glutamyl-tRNA(Gln) amidotransferase subunit D
VGSADYKGKASELLIENDIKIGQSINIHTNNGKYSGILLPRYELFDDNHVVIKLRNGYNIGINLTKIRSIEKVNSDSQYDVYKFKKDLHNLIQTIGRADSSDQNKDEGKLPKVALISTGGTIGSKIDYRTGGVTSVLSASDLYLSVPEISKYASVDTDALLNEYSENLRPEHWTLMANKIIEKVNMGIYRGIILSH